MSDSPAWLPSIVSVNGDWDEVVLRLYSIFDGDFRQSSLSLQGIPIWWDRRILPGDKYEGAFWHLITRDDKTSGGRLLDPRRAERLCWCAAILRHATDSSVSVWDYREGNGRIRTYVWLVEWDYVIVLEKKQKRVGLVYFLVTAFHIDGDSMRRSLRRKYEQRID